MLVNSVYSLSKNVFFPSLNEFQFFSHLYLFICKYSQLGLVCLFGVLNHINSTVFQLTNGDSSQIQAFWTIFNQYLTSPLS